MNLTAPASTWQRDLGSPTPRWFRTLPPIGASSGVVASYYSDGFWNVKVGGKNHGGRGTGERDAHLAVLQAYRALRREVVARAALHALAR